MKISTAILLFIISTMYCWASDNNRPVKYSGEFLGSDDYSHFHLADYHLSIDSTGEKFAICKGSVQIGSINIRKEYSGPGFCVHLFETTPDDYRMIVIEAMADNGTAWYSVALLGKEKVIGQRFIDEPRANSETCHIRDFMRIAIVDDYCQIGLAIKNIAGYSYIPKDLKVDSSSVYLTIPVIERKQD